MPPLNQVEMTRLLAGLREFEQMIESLLHREWSEDRIRAMTYTDASLAELRHHVLQEQVKLKQLQTDAHMILLNEAQAMLPDRSSAP